MHKARQKPHFLIGKHVLCHETAFELVIALHVLLELFGIAVIEKKA
jgi:hypothetical protein